MVFWPLVQGVKRTALPSCEAYDIFKVIAVVIHSEHWVVSTCNCGVTFFFLHLLFLAAFGGGMNRQITMGGGVVVLISLPDSSEKGQKSSRTNSAAVCFRRLCFLMQKYRFKDGVEALGLFFAC